MAIGSLCSCFSEASHNSLLYLRTRAPRATTSGSTSGLRAKAKAEFLRGPLKPKRQAALPLAFLRWLPKRPRTGASYKMDGKMPVMNTLDANRLEVVLREHMRLPLFCIARYLASLVGRLSLLFDLPARKSTTRLRHENGALTNPSSLALAAAKEAIASCLCDSPRSDAMASLALSKAKLMSFTATLLGPPRGPKAA